MEKVTLTRIAVTDKRKDGTILEGKYGKFYRVGIQTKEYGEEWINGFSNTSVEWAEGDVMELDISKEEWNGKEQLKFKLPKKEDLQADEIEKLKAQLAEKNGEVPVIDMHEEETDKKEDDDNKDTGAF